MCGGGRAALQYEISPGSEHIGKGFGAAETELKQADRKESQGLAATASYLAGDRMDIEMDVSILTQVTTKPKVVGQPWLARLAAYLSAHPQLTRFYPYGEFPDKIHGEVDAGRAENLETRRSRDGA